MNLDIHERDISSRLCGFCAACCRVKLGLPSTNTRYRQFLRQLGFTLVPPAEEGKRDCCDKDHDITIDLGECKHLGTQELDGVAFRRCKIYGTEEFPLLCAQYNCVSWAKVHDKYSLTNELLVKAQAAKDMLQVNGDLPVIKEIGNT